MGLFGGGNDKSSPSTVAVTAEGTKAQIARALEDKGLKFQDVSQDGVNALRLGFGLENYKDFAIFVFVDPDGTSYQLRSNVIMHVDEAKRQRVLEAANQVNRDYRWIRFYIDDDGDLISQADADFSPATAGQVPTAVMRAAGVMDAAYPEFMRAQWA